MTTVLVILGVVGFFFVGKKASESRGAQANVGAGQIVCPHCQQRGHVTIRLLDRKTGISGGKAAGAVLTGGLSAAATGLSRKELARQLTCGNCKMQWDVV